MAGDDPRRLEYVRFAALMSVAAAVVHASVVPTHLHEYGPFGVLFLIAATLQAGWAWRAWADPGRGVLVGGCALSLVLVAVWVWSRTVGLPIGPERWTPESAGPLDVQATVDEFLVVALVAWSTWPPRRGGWISLAWATEAAVAMSLLGSFLLPAAGHGIGH
jgi:hypothetical protein